MADFKDYVGLDMTPYFLHYGRGHLDGGNSGRYPWGSTNNVKPTSSTAKETTKFLNKSEKSLAKGISKSRILNRKLSKLVKKQNKALDKYIKENKKNANADPFTSKKVQKLEAKMNTVEYELDVQQDQIDRIKDSIDSTVRRLTDSGYDVKAKQTLYDVAFGKYLVSQFALGPAGVAVLSTVIKPNEQIIDGYKWKISVPDNKSARKDGTAATVSSSLTEDAMRIRNGIESISNPYIERAKELNSTARDLRYMWDADMLNKRKYNK